jgi:ATP-dependent DNA ligase
MSVKALKPKFLSLKSFDQIRITPTTIIQAKADGDFNLITFVDQDTSGDHTKDATVISMNQWGTARYSYTLPCLNDLKEALILQNFKSAKFLAELYAVDDEGKMLQLPHYIHHVKAGDKSKIRLGIFNCLSVNGARLQDNTLWKLKEVEGWLRGYELCHVLPYAIPEKPHDIEDFWNYYVEQMKYEGLIARYNGDLYKVKRHATVDAVIIGINKKPKLKERQVTSLKVAVMSEDGLFIELSDVASGIDHQLRKKLFDTFFTKLAGQTILGQDKDTYFVAPLIVVEVGYQETFSKDKRVFAFQQSKLQEKGKVPLYTLRHPKLIQFRTDKLPIPTDIGVEQFA